jgi:hypothetical protein
MMDETDLTLEELDAFWDDGDPAEVRNRASEPLTFGATPWTGRFRQNGPAHHLSASDLAGLTRR